MNKLILIENLNRHMYYLLAGHQHIYYFTMGLVWGGDRGTCPPHVFGGGGQKALRPPHVLRGNIFLFSE